MPTDPLSWLNDDLQRWDDQSLRRTLRVRQGPQRPSAVQVDGRPLINFGSNDYLGLAGDALLQGSVIRSLPSYGWGSGASPLVTGHAQPHEELHRELARFKGRAAALLFSSGYAANVGTIPALVGKPDTVLSDARNHASIIDGCRLSGARIQVYRHADLDSLRQLLEGSRHFRRRLIVTNTLFGMDGDIAPLASIAELAQRFDCMLMVDEAHATGVFGEHGRGLCEQLGVEEAVHVQMGTLSKALGSSGGYVAGSQPLIDWLINTCRTYVFSTAPCGATPAAGLAALQLVQDEPHRRQVLLQRSQQLRLRLRELGFDVGDSQSQIVPIYIGSPSQTMRLHQQLLHEGVLVPGIRPPSVPVGQSLLRISVSYAHQETDLRQLVDALCRIEVPRG